jgi:hypothetical protein
MKGSLSAPFIGIKREGRQF